MRSHPQTNRGKGQKLNDPSGKEYNEKRNSELTLATNGQAVHRPLLQR